MNNRNFLGGPKRWLSGKVYLYDLGFSIFSLVFIQEKKEQFMNNFNLKKLFKHFPFLKS
jgi:hypothetical protein